MWLENKAQRGGKEVREVGRSELRQGVPEVSVSRDTNPDLSWELGI